MCSELAHYDVPFSLGVPRCIPTVTVGFISLYLWKLSSLSSSFLSTSPDFVTDLSDWIYGQLKQYWNPSKSKTTCTFNIHKFSAWKYAIRAKLGSVPTDNTSPKNERACKSCVSKKVGLLFGEINSCVESWCAAFFCSIRFTVICSVKLWMWFGNSENAKRKRSDNHQIKQHPFDLHSLLVKPCARRPYADRMKRYFWCFSGFAEVPKMRKHQRWCPSSILPSNRENILQDIAAHTPCPVRNGTLHISDKFNVDGSLTNVAESFEWSAWRILLLILYLCFGICSTRKWNLHPHSQQRFTKHPAN